MYGTPHDDRIDGLAAGFERVDPPEFSRSYDG
jgi:hypothetical protein